MNSDTQRILLWIVFGLSAFMLWDRWQVFNGEPGMLGDGLVGKQVEQQLAKDEVPKPNTDVPTAKATVPDSIPSAVVKKGETVTVESDIFRLSFDTEGAIVSRAELLKYTEDRDWQEDGIVGMVLGKTRTNPPNKLLFEPDNHKYLAQTGVIGGAFPNHRTVYRLVSDSLKMADGADTLDIQFEAESGGVKVVKTYTLHRGRYDIDVRHELVNTGSTAVSPSVYYQLQRDDRKPDNQNSMYYTYTGAAVYDSDTKFKKVEWSDIQKNNRNFKENVDNGWVALIEHYFVSAWIPADGAPRENYLKPLSDTLNAIGSIVPAGTVEPGQSVVQNAKLYTGPQDQEALSELSKGLDLVVDYGWLTFLAKPIYWVLTFLHSIIPGHNWGWAIVALTCIVKLILYPLSLAGYRSMAKMKDLGPKMQELRQMYGDDKQRMNQAMMEFYKKEKINPVGGCLPILLQMPVFIALYWVLLASVELRGAPWILWVQDLASPDVWFILPAIMMVTMFLQFKLNPTPPDPTQAKMMMIMPIVFGVMFFFFASGLVLYWLINNILSIAQQWAVNKQIANDRKNRLARKAANE